MLQLIYNDFKLIFREPSLRIFLVLPFLLLLIVNYFLPFLMEKYEVISLYIPYVLMGATTQTSTMFSFIYSMVFIDEKDTQVAKVYGVLPINQLYYILLRLLIPFLLATFFTLLILWTQPFYNLPLLPCLALAFLTAFVAPLVALVVAALAKNKMEGMTWIKAFNFPIILPILSFFVPAAYSICFAIAPTYWAFQALNDLIQNSSSALHLAIGFIYSCVLLVFLARF